MTDGPRPGLTPKAIADHRARLEREAIALRENLRRRKAQRRAKAKESPSPLPASDEPASK